MRRTIFLLLAAILAALVSARGAMGAPAAETMGAAVWDAEAYNVLELDLAAPRETAGSARIAEMTGHFLSRRPTAKHAYTGALAGRDLIVLLADAWAPEALPQEGVRFGDVCAPDWYQGREGREFALLSGLTPTNVQDKPSMSLLAEKEISLPFALASAMGRAGYVCRACPAGTGREAAYKALGFSSVAAGAPPEEQVEELAQGGPFFLYAQLPDQDPEAALERVLRTLDRTGRTEGTAVCLVTGSAELLRGGLYLWARGLEGLCVSAPCSELDVTPTLLDLFGVPYDSRFLSGRDLLADGTEEGPTPPVALAGSAYAGWASDAGRYDSAEGAFTPAAGRSPSAQEQRQYVALARQQVYDQYVFSRRILECDYFRQVMGR